MGRHVIYLSATPSELHDFHSTIFKSDKFVTQAPRKTVITMARDDIIMASNDYVDLDNWKNRWDKGMIGWHIDIVDKYDDYIQLIEC